MVTKDLNSFNNCLLPADKGSKIWRTKWFAEYKTMKKRKDFFIQETRIGQLAREDFNYLNNSKILISYRKYRRTNLLQNILIARRVISASIFINSLNNRGNIINTEWEDVCFFLRFERYNIEGLKNFAYNVGLKLSGVINYSTLLQEEIEWLRKNDFL